MTIDVSELTALRRDLGQVGMKGLEQVSPAMKRAGVQMKKAMQADLRSSRHFRSVARSITFDLRAVTAFGVRNYAIEVGPDAARAGSAALAGIAYFGGSRGGGGTVPDPIRHAETEADKVVEAVLAAVGKVL
ncbi:hypothetical protein [Zhihengliuella sp.]|uniref:hypothetical protein n=1 Tax=Zhihengliuella sp. TaxID=1954483 RepID=UPI0028110DFB|nr:hypothetical protein [Zhihengliuella sp.]